MNLIGKLNSAFRVPTLTRLRIFLALAVAVIADALQFILLPVDVCRIRRGCRRDGFGDVDSWFSSVIAADICRRTRADCRCVAHMDGLHPRSYRFAQARAKFSATATNSTAHAAAD